MRKIYTNQNNEIVALDETELTNLTLYEVEDSVLGDWEDLALLGFKYLANYDKNKELISYEFYPFVESTTISAMQSIGGSLKSMKTDYEDLCILMAEGVGR